MKHLVVLTGAGISAESGLKTFRDSDGLWEEYSIYDVATPEAWQANKALVLEFYNQRRKQLLLAKANRAHKILHELESHFRVSIITQNIDDLHEQAGSSTVMHLHGELKKARSTVDPTYIVAIESGELKLGDTCPKGGQLRPHVVWFGEDVPMIEPAAELARQADLFLVVGTSLNVYPAAGLLYSVPRNTPIFLVDPQPVAAGLPVTHIMEPATLGMEMLKTILLKDYL